MYLQLLNLKHIPKENLKITPMIFYFILVTVIYCLGLPIRLKQQISNQIATNPTMYIV